VRVTVGDGVGVGLGAAASVDAASEADRSAVIAAAASIRRATRAPLSESTEDVAVEGDGGLTAVARLVGVVGDEDAVVGVVDEDGVVAVDDVDVMPLLERVGTDDSRPRSMVASCARCSSLTNGAVAAAGRTWRGAALGSSVSRSAPKCCRTAPPSCPGATLRWPVDGLTCRIARMASREVLVAAPIAAVETTDDDIVSSSPADERSRMVRPLTTAGRTPRSAATASAA
jgi:hypothetical protein